MYIRSIILLLFGLSSLSAAERWIRLTAPELEVVTDAGENTARDAMKRFKQVRHVFEARTGRKQLTSLPVRVYAFRNQDGFRPFQTSAGAAGYYQPGIERDYIAMQLSGPDSYRVVYHEFAHLLMRHSGYSVPVWLNEGTAELFSTISLGSSDVRIGELIPAHLATLRDVKMLELAELFRVNHESPHYNERGKSGIFYAQSWALVHMLNFAPEYQPGLANFIGMVLNGEDQARAFQQSFGKSLATATSNLSAYIRQNRFSGIRFPLPKMETTAKAPVEPLSASSAALLQAELLLSIRKDVEAESIYARELEKQPDLPDIHAAMGDLALRRNQDEVAIRRYQHAIELGSKSGRVRLELAMLLRENAETSARVIPLLQEAIQLDPQLSEAHQLLGFTFLRHHKYPEAVQAFRHTLDLQPGRASTWEELALAYYGLGDRQKALEAAQNARRLASTPEESSRIDATIQLIEQGSDKTV